MIHVLWQNDPLPRSEFSSRGLRIPLTWKGLNFEDLGHDQGDSIRKYRQQHEYCLGPPLRILVDRINSFLKMDRLQTQSDDQRLIVEQQMWLFYLGTFWYSSIINNILKRFTSLKNSPAHTTTISRSSSSCEKSDVGPLFSGSWGSVSPLCRAILLLVRWGDRIRPAVLGGNISRIRFGTVMSICHGHRSQSPSMQGNHELVDPGRASFVV